MTVTVEQAVVDAALEIADKARKITLEYFRQPLEIQQKSDHSPVTIADQQTEALIRKEILDRFPAHGFFGEESGRTASDADWVWVVDPIDGTTSFATGKPTFGTLIALAYRGQPVLGIVDIPALDDRWLGVQGRSTLYNGEPVRCNPSVSELSQSSAYTTTTKMFDQAAMPAYLALSSQCKFSVFGADCLAYGLLASGFTEIVVEAALKPYDFMALVPVVEGAGGVISDWQGGPVTIDSGDRVVAAANIELHQKMLKALHV